MESAESVVFQKYHENMVLEFKHSLPTLVDKFYTAGFIDGNEQEVLPSSGTGLPSQERASRLVQSIRSKIESDRTRFEKFMDVLNSCGGCFDSLISKLQGEIRSIRKRKANIECKILMKHHFLLVGAYQSSVLSVLAQGLKQKNLISLDDITEWSDKSSTSSRVDRAITIVNHVEMTIEQNPAAFEIFASMLDEHFPNHCLGSLLREEKRIWTRIQQQQRSRQGCFSYRSKPLCPVCKLSQKCSELSAIEMIRHDRQEKTKEVDSLRENNAHLLEEIQKLKETNQRLERSEQQLRERLKSKENQSSEVERLQAELAEKEQQKNELLKKIMKLEKEGQEKNQKEIEELKQKLCSIEDELRDVKLKLERAEHKLELATVKHEHALREQELELKLKWTKEDNERREKEREKERQVDRAEKNELMKRLLS